MADENIEKIDLRCPGCKVKIRAPVSLIGKKAKCPRCQNIFNVVEPDVPLAPTEIEEPKEEEAPPKPITTANKPATQKIHARPITGAHRPMTGRPMGTKPPLRPTTAGRKFAPTAKTPMGMKFAKPVGAQGDEGIGQGIVEPPKKSKRMLIIIVIAALLIIGGIVFFIVKKKSTIPSESSQEQKPSSGTSAKSPPPSAQK